MNNCAKDMESAKTRRASPAEFRIQIPAEKNRLEETTAFLERALDELGVRGEARGHICVAFDEAVTNVVLYAYPDSKGDMRITIGRADGRVMIEIEDNGRPFNPVNQPEPDTNASIDKRLIGGLGIHLIRHMMDELHYKRVNNVNQFSMIKNIPEDKDERSNPVHG